MPPELAKPGPASPLIGKSDAAISRKTGLASLVAALLASCRKIILSGEAIHVARDALFQGRLIICRKNEVWRAHFHGCAGVDAACRLRGRPRFQEAAAPEVGDYTAASLSTTAATPRVAGGDAQRFLKGSDISGDWWTLFHSKALNDLIDRSLKNNSDLKAAEATLRRRMRACPGTAGGLFSAPRRGFSASHQQQPGTLAPVPTRMHFSMICSRRN